MFDHPREPGHLPGVSSPARRRRPTPPVFLLILLVLLRPASARAQVQVAGVRDLAFGLVIAGVPVAVPPGDPTRSGEFTVDAPRGSRISVSFVLPSALAGPPGARKG